MSWDLNLFFCICLGICSRSKFLQSFQFRVVRHAQQFQISSKFQVGVVRHAQIDWNQQVRYFSKIILAVNFIFCIWLGIRKYIYLIQSIHISVVRYTWACQKWFPRLNWAIYIYMNMFIKKGKFLQILWHVTPLLQNYPASNTGALQSLTFYTVVRLKVGSWKFLQHHVFNV